VKVKSTWDGYSFKQSVQSSLNDGKDLICWITAEISDITQNVILDFQRLADMSFKISEYVLEKTWVIRCYWS